MASSIFTPASQGYSSGHDGGFGRRDDFGGGNDFGNPQSRISAQTYKTGMWFALAAIVMLFAGFTSAMVVRRGMSLDWASIAIPRLLWVNTCTLLASSATLELSRRALRKNAPLEFIRWLLVTFTLGAAFLACQMVVWRELIQRGVHLATNPSSAFFYVLTAAHGLHVLGGVIALGYVVLNAVPIALGRKLTTALDVTAIYWHFVDALWLYLFCLLIKWL